MSTTPATEEPVGEDFVASMMAATGKSPAPTPEPEPTPAPEPDPQPEPEPEPEGDKPLSIREQFHRLTGQDVSHYPDDETFLRSTADWRRTASTKLEAAELGKRLEALGLGEADVPQLAEFLASKREPPKQDGPPPFEQEWLSQVTYDDDGNPVAAKGADPDVVNKLRRWMRYRERETNKFFQSPNEYLQPLIEAAVAQVEQRATEAARATVSQSTAEQRIQAWEKDNAKWLFRDGDRERGWSPEGQRVFDLCTKLTGIPDIVERAEEAASLVRQQRAGSTPPKRIPPATSTHQPAIAPGTGGEKTPAERVDGGEDFIKVMQELFKAPQ